LLAKATTQKPGLAPGFCFLQILTGFVILNGVKDLFLSLTLLLFLPLLFSCHSLSEPAVAFIRVRISFRSNHSE
jgi:hypothetical protein